MKNSKDIALIAPAWWLIPSRNTVTATEHIVEDYSYHLKRLGYNNVIFSRAKDNTDRFGISDINRYSNTYVYTKVLKFERKFLRKNNLFFYLIYILKVSLKINRLGIKKIVVFQTFPFCFWIKVFNPKSKLLFHTGGHELSKNENYFNYGYISDRLAKIVFEKTDCILAVSKHIQKGIVNRFPMFKNKIKVVYAGVDTNTFKRRKKKISNPVIVFAGRVVPEKGIYLLIKAFKNLKKEFKNLHLYIIGESLGPNIPTNFNNIFKIEGLKRFPLLPRRELAKILSKGNIFVYPVIMEEAFGLAPIEAMASGLITVVSNSKSGYREIIKDRVNGYYFKYNDERDLERVLKEILLSLDRQNIVRENAIKTIKENLNWDTCIKKTVKYF
jgi:glycosyltransferase involved in cell wall biosynthesis